MRILQETGSHTTLLEKLARGFGDLLAQYDKALDLESRRFTQQD